VPALLLSAAVAPPAVHTSGWSIQGDVSALCYVGAREPCAHAAAALKHDVAATVAARLALLTEEAQREYEEVRTDERAPLYNIRVTVGLRHCLWSLTHRRSLSFRAKVRAPTVSQV